MDDPSRRKSHDDFMYQALLNMQQQYLEALRSREKEALQYIVLLASSLGGFAWALKLLPLTKYNYIAFVGIILAVLLVLMLGAVYSLALGYNYRYLILQLRKVENALCVTKHILCYWSKANKDNNWKSPIGRTSETEQEYDDKFRPPEVIKQFWIAYLWGIALVSFIGCVEVSRIDIFIAVIIAFFGVCMWILSAIYIPDLYKQKLNRIRAKEKELECQGNSPE